MSLRSIWRRLRAGSDSGSWLEPGRILACGYPRDERRLDQLVGQGISVLINLHVQPNDPARLARAGITEVHLPVRDFTAPSPQVLRDGVEAITAALGHGKTVAVHCGAGLGRTGTLLACFLVEQGVDADEAIARVRAARPGSVETRAQVAAIRAFAANRSA